MKTARSVLLAIAISLIFLLVYRRFVPRQNTFAPAPSGPYELQVRSIPVIHNLALGEFDVPAKSTHDVKIAVDETQTRSARLSGVFSVEGSQAVEVMLLDGKQYMRFRNHETPSEFLYLSKATTNGTIAAAIPRADTYYLVFDNSSSESSARVKADVTVRYDTVHVDSGAGKKK